MSRCPSLDDLELLLEEQLADADSRDVADHVAVCDACQAALERLTDDTQTLSKLAAGKPETLARDASPLRAGASGSPLFLLQLKQASVVSLLASCQGRLSEDSASPPAA